MIHSNEPHVCKTSVCSVCHNKPKADVLVITFQFLPNIPIRTEKFHYVTAVFIHCTAAAHLFPCQFLNGMDYADINIFTCAFWFIQDCIPVGIFHEQNR